MDKISAGKYVELCYDINVLRGDKKEPVYSFTPSKPDRFVYGQDLSMIEGFMRGIEGLEVGDTFDFSLNPEEAFGHKNPELIMDLEKSLFVVDGKFDDEHVCPGAFVPMQTQDGMRIDGLVTAVTDDTVTLDFNHQLAGERVNYKGRVLIVRDATPEELAPKHHHCGCGCDHYHDHGHCDCDECQGCD